MPAAVPLVAAVAGAAATGAGVFGATLLGSTFLATAANAAFGFVVSTAVNQLGSKAVAKKPKGQQFTQDAQGRTLLIRSSVETHKLVYGTAKVSGPMTFAITTDNAPGNATAPKANKMLHVTVPLAGHEVDEIVTVYANDVPLTIVGDYVMNAPYHFNGASYVIVRKHTGATDQAADEVMVRDCPNWTAAHRGRGIAYLYLRMEYHPDVFPTGFPNISAVVKGKKVYDPRAATTAWSENAALCVRDYLIHECDIASARIPDSYLNAAANVCDEAVTLSTGGTQSRYTCNGVIDTGVSRRDNLQALLSAMAGEVIRVGTQVRVFAGAYEAPVGEVTDDMLAGPVVVRGRTQRTDLVNTVRGTYVDPNKSYQPTDFPPYTNATHVGQDAGIVYAKDLDLAFTNHPEMAQRIAKLIEEKSRQGITVDMPLNHAALKFSTGDTITYSQAHLGWTDKEFRIRRMTMANVPAGAIRLTLQEESAASYDWNSGEATAVDAAPDTTLPSPFDVEPPGAPQVTETKYVTTDGSGVKSKATVTWVASPDAFAREYQLEYKLTSATEYTVVGRTDGTSLELLDAVPGTYDLRVKAVSTLGVSSAYTGTVAEIVGLTDAPAALTNFSLNAINNNAHLSWDPLPADDLDVRIGGSIRVRHSKLTSGASWSNALDIGPAVAGGSLGTVLPLLSGTYLAKAVDSAGNESLSAAVITTTAPDIVKMNTVAASTQHPAFAGLRDNMVLADGALQIDTARLFDSGVGDFDDGVGYFDFGGEGIADVGVYYFDAPVDVGKVATCRVTADVALTLNRVNALFDDGQGDFDDGTGLFDGDDLTGVTVRLELRTTDGDPAGSPTWSAWRPFFVGDYTARGFQFRLYAQNDSGSGFHDVQVFVTELAVTVDMPDVVDQGSLTTGTGGRTAVSFARTFVSVPAVGVTIKNGATGDYLDVQNATATGFEVGVKNAAGGYVARGVDWISRGY